MERRGWIWHSKSSGETESSESMSSHSERLSDDQVYATRTAPSSEVTSKAASNEDVVTDVLTLTEKLSAALLDVSSKEDLIKQNAKVAEEAVSGWEKAENEVLTLKQELDAAKQKNVVLEDRVSHLNGELKDCMRQLRQAREEQDQKIHEAIANNSCYQESKRPDLEWKVAELEAQLQTAKENAATSVHSGLLQRLEDVERENSCLKIELQSRLEELEFKTIERDLSTESAEAASKQHLESLKKVAKLDTEWQRLNAVAQNHIGLSTQNDLMDDFLEMERLAALPDTESVSSFSVVGNGTDKMNAEVEALVQKNSTLEKKLVKMEADKVELEMDLYECQKQLEVSQSRVKETELAVIELQTQLDLANKSNEEAYDELKAAREKNEKAESKLRAAQTEAEELISKISSLEEEIEKEQALSAENLAKCEKLEDELLRMKQEAQLQQDTEILHKEGADSKLMFNQEKELELAANRFSECRKTIESLGQQLKSLAKLEDFLLDSEDTTELTSEVTPPDPKNNSDNSDLSSPKIDSELSDSPNPSISFGKSHFSFGMFYPTRA
ncbi:filament-like plant protein 3 [Lathyrus oleraceus]|uniref:Filament-like plant protein n=1 Tax=Pisum sativum TaxID=3888 RepID=A0A9D4WL84_PEA|nr:filament-like plant protein 3 [Pisum sativum]XP_050875464.1 filament-like plant protein 3 [Pisum sativum]KAI5404909.1 hypothetical protein KIW84_051894 [Pisum sativum]